MKGDGRKPTIYRKIGKDKYIYRLKKKRICDAKGKSGKCIAWHYEMRYEGAGRLGGEKKKPAILDGLSASQIERLRAWRKKGISLDDLQDQINDWGFPVSRKTMTRFFQKHKIVRGT